MRYPHTWTSGPVGTPYPGLALPFSLAGFVVVGIAEHLLLGDSAPFVEHDNAKSPVKYSPE